MLLVGGEVAADRVGVASGYVAGTLILAGWDVEYTGLVWYCVVCWEV